MELLDKLYTLFRHYDNAEFPLPMADTFDRTDQDYQYITKVTLSFISKYAKKDAEKWAAQIHNNPDEFLESRINRLKEYFAYADKCEQEARKQDDSTDMAYKSLAYCFYECAVFHAVVLYRECYKQKRICADIFFIPGAELSDISKQIGLWDYHESRQYLCQHCSKDCNHRCSQPLETITQTTKNGSLNNRETPPINTDSLLDCFPGIKVFFDRLVRKGYLNEDYSTTTAMNDTFASIVAHEIALELNFKALYSPFEKFWGIKDLRNKYNKAKSRDCQKKNEYREMLSVMFRKKIDGINDEITDTERVDKAMKRL